jgi:hypothetical protein
MRPDLCYECDCGDFREVVALPDVQRNDDQAHLHG